MKIINKFNWIDLNANQSAAISPFGIYCVKKRGGQWAYYIPSNPMYIELFNSKSEAMDEAYRSFCSAIKDCFDED